MYAGAVGARRRPMVRPEGLEPSTPRWHRGALPLTPRPGWSARQVSHLHLRCFRPARRLLRYRRDWGRRPDVRRDLRRTGAALWLAELQRQRTIATRVWLARSDSNRHPAAYQAAALTSCATGQRGSPTRTRTWSRRGNSAPLCRLSYRGTLVAAAGFEPAVTAFRRRDVGHATPRCDLVGPAGHAPAASRVWGGRSAVELRACGWCARWDSHPLSRRAAVLQTARALSRQLTHSCCRGRGRRDGGPQPHAWEEGGTLDWIRTSIRDV